MYVSIGAESPTEMAWTVVPKYDGMRALAFVTPTRGKLMTLNGKDKAAQLLGIATALIAPGRRRRRPMILDGEVVALERNKAGHFQKLQGRFQLKSQED